MNNEIKSYIKNLRDGAILLSTNDLEDPNFKATVIIICIHNSEGTLGLVYNRVSHMPLNEIFNVDRAFHSMKRPIYIGGPVEQESLNIIQITDNPTKNAYKISENVYLGGDWNTIEEILLTDPTTTKLFLGYSGWAPGQLVAEIEEGTWEVYNVNLMEFIKHWNEPTFNDYNKIKDYLQNYQVKI